MILKVSYNEEEEEPQKSKKKHDLFESLSSVFSEISKSNFAWQVFSNFWPFCFLYDLRFSVCLVVAQFILFE